MCLTKYLRAIYLELTRLDWGTTKNGSCDRRGLVHEGF